MSRLNVSKLLHWCLLTFSVFSIGLYFVERHNAIQQASQFRLAVQGAGAGQWFWDIDANELRWDDRMFELFNAPKDNWEHRNGVWIWRGNLADTPAKVFTDAVFPEDVPLVMSVLNRAIMERSSYQAIFRVNGQDGHTLTIRAGGQVYGGGRFMTGLCIKALPEQRVGSLDTSYAVPRAAYGYLEPPHRMDGDVDEL